MLRRPDLDHSVPTTYALTFATQISHICSYGADIYQLPHPKNYKTEAAYLACDTLWIHMVPTLDSEVAARHT